MVEARPTSGPQEPGREAQVAPHRSDIVKTEKKHKKHVRRARSALVAIGLAAVATLPQVHNTERIIRAEFGHSVSCVGSTQASSVEYDSDVIAVPSVTSMTGKDGKLVPNREEASRLAAAVDIYNAGFAPHIVVLGSPSEVDPYAHAKAEVEYLQHKQIAETDSPFPDGVIVVGSKSRNTAENMGELKGIMDQHGWRKAVVVTNTYHEPRTLVQACKEGIAAYPLSAEQILLKNEHGAKPIVNKIDASISIYDRFEEKVGILAALIP